MFEPLARRMMRIINIAKVDASESPRMYYNFSFLERIQIYSSFALFSLVQVTIERFGIERFPSLLL